ncbi:MAG: PilZ domain-containing protein [Aquificaceae bacterium]
MSLVDLLSDIRSGREYEVITSWKEIPIRLKLMVRWASPQERFVSFDFKECKFKHVFSDQSPVYIKIGELFLLCKVFSNIRDELVLEVDSPVPAPPIVLREFIRVQPTEREPVYVSFCLGNDCVVRLKAVDISESGVGIIAQKDDASRIMDILSQIASDIQRIHTPLDVEIELPREGTIRAKGELKNIIGGQGNIYIRLGLKINLEENQRRKIRQYIMKRQREILDQLRSL